jgi:hypothetical protein
MRKEDLVSANIFCTHHNVEVSFIKSLSEHGLIEITTIEQEEFISTDKIKELEKLVRMHYNLEINLEGIEAITFLLQRIETMQVEIGLLKNKLRMYENEAD